ncbi:MAG: hypothetical protein ACI308_00175 [Muribaculaceae bacterium]
MMKRILQITIAAAAMVMASGGIVQLHAADGTHAALLVDKPVQLGDTITGELAQDLLENEDLNKKVIVGKDTVSVIIPDRNYGRYHRGLYTHLFVPKGQFAFGLQASYRNASSEDFQLLSYITDLDFAGTIYSFKPYMCYFYNHNRCLGVRFGFSRTDLDLNSFSVDFDDDVNFDVRDVKYYTNSVSWEVFHRSYIGLDNSRRFAVFNEVAFKYGNGNGLFRRLYDDQPKETKTNTNEVRLDFSPGLCVFVQEKVAFNVSFGIFGWYWRRDRSSTAGAEEDGTRSTSGAKFKINLMNLKLGVAVFL